MFEESPYERPRLPKKSFSVHTSYLVRSLANGLYYYLAQTKNGEMICATNAPYDAKGFPSRGLASAFGKRLEREKSKDICIGRPPYTRIEVRKDQIEVTTESDESSDGAFL